MCRLWLIWVALAIGGCMSVSDMGQVAHDQLSDAGVLDHSQTRRLNNFRLQPDSFMYIAQGPFVPPGGTYPRPNVVAEEAFSAFIQYFPMVRRAPQPLGLEEALSEARGYGANYLLYTRFAASDDRVGNTDEFQDQNADRLGIDSGVVQMMVIETTTRYLIDSATIRARGGLLTLYNHKPADLLGPPMRDYARSLLGVSQ
ncbi:DUF4823 domain-containing protein [Pseudomonas typographi]|uniref:DUF4823 domain-containing protein n=1 Tax=Pseudomonas typographi TaxID=2715964 RepID=A0ABR7YY98_9PSED|nr:DUF4823 domain-containing protein [Pseudomonas typographi]MBD1550378.1 DUF4823 domain-containing protein [Pseudomonas typographi]MBD1588877.1 DUF4823 domain-containing protein [Pseudomonas typographi]MBD1598155.1 DUF4823 domain-containing protein [Pseudomonas typographi]